MIRRRCCSPFSDSAPYALAFFVFVLAGIILHAPLFGQTSNTAIMQGHVRAFGGEPISGAHLELLHVPTGAILRTEAGDDGSYLFSGVRVGGPFTLKVTHIGFTMHIRSGITLGPFEKVRLDLSLQQADLPESEVVITGARPEPQASEAAGISLHVDRDQMDALPRVSGSLEDAHRLSPYMTGESALGFNRMFNELTLDGIGIGDEFGLQHGETLPAGMAASPLSMESIEDVRVDISPFDVQRSGFTGAAISASTRSGSRAFTGSAFGSAAGGWLLGRDPDDGRTDLQGFLDQRAGFRAGGPLIGTMGFFFVAAEVSRMRLPIERRFGAPTTGGNMYSFPASSITRFLTALDTAYGYDAGRMDVVPLERTAANVFARLDMNIAAGHRLTARYNLMISRTDRPPYETSVYASGALARNLTTAHSFLVSLNSVLGHSVSNELLIGYTRRRFTSAPQGEAFPSVDIVETDRLQWWNHLRAGIDIGGNGLRADDDHVELRNSTSVANGEHLFSFGLQGDLHVFRSSLLTDVWGQYTFQSYAAFMRGVASAYEYRYPRTPGVEIWPRWRTLQAGVFLQDDITMSPSVSVSAGIRFDLPVFPDKPVENPVVHDAFTTFGYNLSTSRVPESHLMVSPRVGITVDPKADHSVRIRGGVGVFTGRIPYAWLGNLYDHTGLDYVHIKRSAGSPAFVADPYHQPAPGTGNSLTETMEIVTIAQDFVLPQEIRWSLGVDLSFAGNIIVSLESVFSRTLNGVVFRNINLRPNGTLKSVGQDVALNGSHDEREIYGIPSVTGQWVYSRNDDRFTSVMVMSNSTQGSTTFHTVLVQRRPEGNGVFLSLAYSNGSTEDINSGLWDNAYDQWRYNPAVLPNEPRLNSSSLDRGHRIAAAAAWKNEWAPGLVVTFGVAYTGTSGTPFSYVYDGDLNGDGESYNDLFYVPANYTNVILADRELDSQRLPTDPQYNELFKLIAEDPYLASHRGLVADRNGARTPWIHQVDLRLAQTVPLLGGHQIEISGELLNVLNLMNASWGQVRIVPNQTVPILKLYKFDFAGRPWFEWAPRTSPVVPEPLLSRWRLRLGVRYTF